MNNELENFVKKEFDNPGSVLDLGCGDGEDIKALEKMGWNCEGVDINMGVDLNKPYFSKDAPFDLVCSNHLLHFLNNKEELIKTAYNNLKSDGRFFFEDLERSQLTSDKYLYQEEMEELIKHAGFEIEQSAKFDYYDDKPGHKHWHVIVEIHALKVGGD